MSASLKLFVEHNLIWATAAALTFKTPPERNKRVLIAKVLQKRKFSYSGWVARVLETMAIAMSREYFSRDSKIIHLTTLQVLSIIAFGVEGMTTTV